MSLSELVFREDNILLNIPVGESHCRFDEKPLEMALKSIIKETLTDENTIMADPTGCLTGFCPVFVVATEGQNADGPPKLFRSYGYFGDECAIWQAARATTAAPTYFKPAFVEIPQPGGWYIDGGLKRNNPSAVPLEEARNHWESVERFCVVSIGTGRQKTAMFIKSSKEKSGIYSETASSTSWASALTSVISKLPGQKTAHRISRMGPSILALEAFAKELVKMSTSAEDTHEDMLKLTSYDSRVSYHRFNVQRGLDQIGLEEWAKKFELGASTRGYLEGKDTQIAIEKCACDLIKPPMTIGM